MAQIEHPDYYNKGGIECIEVMRAVFGDEAVNDFCLCNAFKYVFRAKSKHKSPIDDLRKARYYLDYIIRGKEKETPADGVEMKCETYSKDLEEFKSKIGDFPQGDFVFCADINDIMADSNKDNRETKEAGQ